MSIAVKADHIHKFDILTTQDVLLAAYLPVKGRMEYQSTTGKDTLKQRRCACGATETYDLERMRA